MRHKSCVPNKQDCMHACTRMQTPTCSGTHAHTQKYVILIAFRRQEWFRVRASMLRYTCIAWLVSNDIFVLMVFNAFSCMQYINLLLCFEG